MLILYALGAALASILVVSLYRAATDPLRSIPGPFLARFNRLWYLAAIARGRFDSENVELHRRYGPVVRVAPGTYSLDVPEAVSSVYGVASRMPKSEWYDAWTTAGTENRSLFSDRDARRHAETRKLFQALYNMSNLVSYEGYVDDCTDVFERQLDGFAGRKEPLDAFHWFQYYAFDVIAGITYSRSFGFLDHGEDSTGVITAIQSTLVYSTLVGIMPEYHGLASMVMRWLSVLGVGAAAGRSFQVSFVRSQVDRVKNERAQSRDAEKKSGGTSLLDDADDADDADDDHSAAKPQSFLDKLLDQVEQEPERINEGHVFMVGRSNVGAGADTTAITLADCLYYLIRHPRAFSRLRGEVDELARRGRLEGEREHVRWEDAKDMPYLQAVIKETMRLHAAIALPLWRDVSEGGAVIGGRYFPEGSTVGLNTSTVHYNTDVFGADAREFRPERWLEEDEEKLKEMSAYHIPFGLGSRTCLGRHISMLEMSKLVPGLVYKYDFEMVNGNKPWTTRNFWFVKPVNFKVKVQKRFE